MERKFKEALKNRRTIYSIIGESPISDHEIGEILGFALMNIPSAFNSQTTRIVLLLGEEHKKLWNIVKNTLRPLLSAEAFRQTEQKIDGSFASGYGTVLFLEDESVVNGLKKSFPTYQDKFSPWSQQTSAMHQLAVWTMLEDAGLGASLQHYNPLIDDEVRRTWKLPEHWSLVAQMPFGLPTQAPGEKTHQPLEERLRIFKS